MSIWVLLPSREMHVVHITYILSVCSLQEQQAGFTQVTDYLFEDPWTYNITNALVKKNYARVSRAVFFLRFISSLTIYHSTAKILGVQRKNIKSIQLNILRSSVLQIPWRVGTIFSVHISWYQFLHP